MAARMSLPPRRLSPEAKKEEGNLQEQCHAAAGRHSGACSSVAALLELRRQTAESVAAAATGGESSTAAVGKEEAKGTATAGETSKRGAAVMGTRKDCLAAEQKKNATASTTALAAGGGVLHVAGAIAVPSHSNFAGVAAAESEDDAESPAAEKVSAAVLLLDAAVAVAARQEEVFAAGRRTMLLRPSGPSVAKARMRDSCVSPPERDTGEAQNNDSREEKELSCGVNDVLLGHSLAAAFLEGGAKELAIPGEEADSLVQCAAAAAKTDATGASKVAGPHAAAGSLAAPAVAAESNRDGRCCAARAADVASSAIQENAEGGSEQLAGALGLAASPTGVAALLRRAAAAVRLQKFSIAPAATSAKGSAAVTPLASEAVNDCSAATAAKMLAAGGASSALAAPTRRSDASLMENSSVTEQCAVAAALKPSADGNHQATAAGIAGGDAGYSLLLLLRQQQQHSRVAEAGGEMRTQQMCKRQKCLHLFGFPAAAVCCIFVVSLLHLLHSIFPSFSGEETQLPLLQEAANTKVDSHVVLCPRGAYQAELDTLQQQQEKLYTPQQQQKAKLDFQQQQQEEDELDFEEADVQTVQEGEMHLQAGTSRRKLKVEAEKREAVSVVFTDFEREDLEEVRQLLLAQREYPVRYDQYSMQYFYSMRLFPQLSRLARVAVSSPPGHGDETAATPTLRRRKGEIVGVVGVSAEQNTAHVTMVAVATAHRKQGLGKKMLQQALYRASMYTAENPSNPSPDIHLLDSQLHVWITQKGPMSLYLSLGYIPVEFVPHYYSSQQITGGYSMSLALPYLAVEERLKETLRLQEELLHRRQHRVKALGGDSAVARRAAATPALVVTAVEAASSEQREQLKHFLTRSRDPLFVEAGRAALSDKRLHSFFFMALPGEVAASGGGAAPVDSAIFLPRLPEDGVVAHVAVGWSSQSDPRAPLYLYEALLTALTQAAAEPTSSMAQVRRVVQSVPVHKVSLLAWCWETGFRFVKFDIQKNGSGRGLQQQIMSIDIPWRKPEEFELQKKTEEIKPHLLALKKQLRELKQLKRGQKLAAEATKKNVLLDTHATPAAKNGLPDSSTPVGFLQNRLPEQSLDADAASDISTADEADSGTEELEEIIEDEEEDDESEREEETKALAGRWDHVQEGYIERRAARRRKQLLQTAEAAMTKPVGIDRGRAAVQQKMKQKQQKTRTKKTVDTPEYDSSIAGSPGQKPSKPEEQKEEEEEEEEEEEKEEKRTSPYSYLGWVVLSISIVVLTVVLLIAVCCRYFKGIMRSRYAFFFFRRADADFSSRSVSDLADVKGGLPQVSPFKRNTATGPRSSTAVSGSPAGAAGCTADSYNTAASATEEHGRRPHVRREGYSKVGTAVHTEYVDDELEEQELSTAV